MTTDKLAQFRNENYLSLESFRRSGEAIRTPVWFAESEGLLYIYSLADAGKVKRVRNNPRIRIAPCDLRGGLKGDWVDGIATILDEDGAARAHKLLTKKYGWMKRIGDLFSRWRKRTRVTIAIRPD
jgi:PPOX class probable F420-dependent enzyme